MQISKPLSMKKGETRVEGKRFVLFNIPRYFRL